MKLNYNLCFNSLLAILVHLLVATFQYVFLCKFKKKVPSYWRHDHDRASAYKLLVPYRDNKGQLIVTKFSC